MLSTDGTNGVPNDIVGVSAFIGLSMSEDAAVAISTESKTLFKEVFSLKDLSDNEADDIYYKNPTHKYLTNVTAGTLLIPKTKIVTANNGSSEIKVNSNIGDLNMMVNESNMTITLSLTKDK
jgi:hypothetical protein